VIADDGVDNFTGYQKDLRSNDRPFPDEEYLCVFVVVPLAAFHPHVLIDPGFSLADDVYLAVLLPLHHEPCVASDDLVLKVLDEHFEPFLLSLDFEPRIVIVKYLG
jgi:hypothetical protein